jgi:glucose/arabinose dehydrogenase
MTTLVRAALAAILLAGGPAVPAGFTLERIATVPGARELAIAPNGDLFAGTLSNAVYLVADAQGTPATPKVFLRLADRPVAGIALDGDRMILGAQFGVYALPYHSGDRSPRAAPRKIAAVRTSGVSRDHETTSVALAAGRVYASIGSSCNVCDPELDATRATIQQMNLDGSGMTAKAVRIRNAIALAVNPQTGTLWAGVAGQDELPHGHPYETFDPVSLHAGTADYGWPYCYENHQAAGERDCSAQVVPRVVFPAYTTPIGAAFYPVNATGAHAFPEEYRGGAFVTLHGSWHTPRLAPRVAFVPLHGDQPQNEVDWNDPSTQWREFVGGFQRADGTRVARPTGIAVGPDGSLFFSDDQTGGIYRVRPQ